MDTTTRAFRKYVDPIFIIQNGLQRYVEQININEYTKEMKLDSYEDEQILRLGLSFKLAKEINKYFNFEITKKVYKQKILNLSKEDLSYKDFMINKKAYENVLNSHAKLMYLFDTYLTEISLKDHLLILGYLVTIYEKSVNIKKKNTNLKLSDVTKTKLYRYIADANLEELEIDIKNYSKYSVIDLIEKCFNFTLNSMYEIENIVVEPMTVIEKDKNGYDYYETLNLHVHIIEENNSFETYKKEREQEAYNWLVKEMHTLPDGRIF